ncbi:DUF4011 domain-containing protein [Nonomuraea endophytica]|uniref:DUF4011 domain-containing protein n=1 Tax=Nonomuraea endophytica TaxID=714136 RepID=UPI0037C7AAB0
MTKPWNSDWPIVDPEIPAEDRKLIESNPQLQGYKISPTTAAEEALAQRLERQYRDRYVIQADLDEVGQRLVSRARVAVNRVLAAEVTRLKYLDDAATWVMLPHQLWELADLLRAQAQLRRKIHELPDTTDLSSQKQGLESSTADVVQRVEELEAYAASVVEADALLNEPRERARIAEISNEINDRHLDLLARTGDTESMSYLRNDAQALKDTMKDSLEGFSDQVEAPATPKEFDLDEGRQARMQAVLSKWRDSLLDLSGRNRLLNFKPGAAGLEIVQPSTARLMDGIGRGMSFTEIPEGEDRPEGQRDPHPEGIPGGADTRSAQAVSRHQPDLHRHRSLGARFGRRFPGVE